MAAGDDLDDAWSAPCEQGRPADARNPQDIAQILRMGPRVAPFLPRTEHVLFLLEQAFSVDENQAQLGFAMPLLRRIAEAPDGLRGSVVRALQLARALSTRSETVEPQPSLSDQILDSVERGEHLTVSSLLGRHSAKLLRTDPVAALAVADQMARYAQRAGLGPWRQISDAQYRLRALNALGRYEEALQEVETLCAQMETLPQAGDAKGLVEPSQVREAILDAGREAAVLGGAWQTALDLNGVIVRSREARGVEPLQLARRRFHDYGPLMRSGRCDEARVLLEQCRATFEAASDISSNASKNAQLIGMVHNALADLADATGDLAAAARYQAAALQDAYAAGLIEGCAIAHASLASYLNRIDKDSVAALAHDLVAALIWHQLSSPAIEGSVHTLAELELRGRWLSYAEVLASVEATPGVQFGALFERLPQRAADGNSALGAVRERVVEARLGDRRAKARRKWRRRKLL